MKLEIITRDTKVAVGDRLHHPNGRHVAIVQEVSPDGKFWYMFTHWRKDDGLGGPYGIHIWTDCKLERKRSSPLSYKQIFMDSLT